MMNTSSFLVSCFCILVTGLNPVFGLKKCEFPAIFNFGDSNSDTGGFAAAFNWTISPYGETFFHTPAGRYSDGRLVIDFIAQSFGLPFLSAYLNSLGSNFTHGANFATAGATIRPPHSVMPIGQFSPFYLDVQYGQFRQFMHRSQIIMRGGGVFRDLMPKNKYFEKALYTVDMGTNDLVEGFSSSSIEEVNASVPNMVFRLSTNLKNIYKLGARYFWIQNVGPVGCLPLILTNLAVTPNQMDIVGCGRPYNEVAQYFNYMLKEAIVQLRKDLPFAVITYVDIYSAKYSLFLDPKTYGFESPLVACCGFGGKYNYSSAGCGTNININGSNIFVGSCARPWARVNWDGVHYTEAANKFIFNQISTGQFSDPPIPLRMACHKILLSTQSYMYNSSKSY